jgi:hypothetical protein
MTFFFVAVEINIQIDAMHAWAIMYPVKCKTSFKFGNKKFHQKSNELYVRDQILIETKNIDF